jgi:hypothetical protein
MLSFHKKLTSGGRVSTKTYVWLKSGLLFVEKDQLLAERCYLFIKNLLRAEECQKKTMFDWKVDFFVEKDQLLAERCDRFIKKFTSGGRVSKNIRLTEKWTSLRRKRSAVGWKMLSFHKKLTSGGRVSTKTYVWLKSGLLFVEKDQLLAERCYLFIKNLLRAEECQKKTMFDWKVDFFVEKISCWLKDAIVS